MPFLQNDSASNPKEIIVRHTLFSLSIAALLLLVGTLVINWQLWHSADTERAATAMHIAQRIDAILDEASSATKTAMRVALNGCSAEGEFELGTEAALKPHLRTIIILKNGNVWCSSLPGNRVLIVKPEAISDDNLLLMMPQNMVNELPVLLFQTPTPAGKVIVSISDAHIRDALNSSIEKTAFSLVVSNRVFDREGNVIALKTLPMANSTRAAYSSTRYPFRIEYHHPSFFSLSRLAQQGAGSLLIVFLLSFAVVFLLRQYRNKYTTPEENLRRAIEKGEIIPFYQPVVNGKTGALYGVEVLARWKHPKAGFISPAIFIPTAEKTGLIVPLTQSLMRQVVAQLKPILNKLPDGFHIGINFSASHINAPCFMRDCMQYQEGFSGKKVKLVLEVTEREPLLINADLINNLNTLHEKGFAIALDDFGTGYSGLSYLNDLLIDYIKIDKSFVSRVSQVTDSTRLLDCVIEMAKKLSLRIVAEGVETKEQLDYLNRNDITLVQGYYFWKPVSYIDLIKILLSKSKAEIDEL
ncbi:cyclic diguanylate phosphodiesterase [Pluralibacter sp.]|uniref:cyclic diguanylate phosphodiesterase n=1 Tax=Pluralibacter sp. TaxID=1920032 RepID=UPI0025CCD3AE|nr:cyclic diguanylate phosphodiesterase [Pluralibacter sp.]MBV8043409.1 cyclic diguanylate phosphodiesterase [Pluralibacter sp.]